MFDIKWIRDNPDAFDRGLTRRELAPLSAKLIKLDEERRALITKLEQAQARRNSASKEIGQAKAKKDEATAQKLMAEVAELKTSIPDLEAKEKEASAALERELAQIPNTPLDEVPDGKDEHDNVEYRVWGKKRDYTFAPKQHFELGEALGQMDFELAAKLSGARFVVLQKGLARLERALGQFFLDVHTSAPHNYTEVNPPILVRDETMFGTAQLPKFEDDQFGTEVALLRSPYEGAPKSVDGGYFDVEFKEPETKKRFDLLQKDRRFSITFSRGRDRPVVSVNDRLWLIPTAEVPLTNLVRESIVEEDTLPRRYTACTPCFRAEAGAAGKDTRGMIRQHQFTKVELVSITTPEKSKEEHERMLNCAEEVLKKLDLHYRVVTLCTGDMGFASQKTYDIEVWLPGQNMFREISSCSVCGDFQARRMNARFRGKDGKPRFVHTLNGSGVAVGRALIAVMETYQQADGSIAVPDALAPYMGGVKVIAKS
ncbi:MAG TPA: serine--tRNA ligase [Pseudolabrys sp.]|nr:serine--tRNA ligase [Pseudolabrys sp.]